MKKIQLLKELPINFLRANLKNLSHLYQSCPPCQKNKIIIYNKCEIKDLNKIKINKKIVPKVQNGIKYLKIFIRDRRSESSTCSLLRRWKQSWIYMDCHQWIYT